RADLAGRAAVIGLGLDQAGANDDQPAPVPASTEPDSKSGAEARTVTAVQRWRLVLGRRAEALPNSARRLASALDELYGGGHGGGSYPVDRGRGGGREASFPSVREWQEELDALFGSQVREEVLARAAAAGRLDVALQIDPATVRPSVDLLHAVLSLAGGM